MKEYPIKIMNLKDLIRFQKKVRALGLHGQIRQMNYVSNIRSGLNIALALPLDAATLCLKEDPKVEGADIFCNATA